MWLEVIILGIIIGLLRGGRLNNLEKISIKGGLFIALAIILQLLPFFLSQFTFIKENTNLFVLAGAILSAIVVLLNIKKAGMPIVFIGIFLNLTVLFFNNYKMPINLTDVATTAKLSAMKLAIQNGEISNYILLSNVDHWSKFLGKTIILPSYYPFTSFLGVPDLLIAVGVIWTIQSEMQNNLASYGTYNSYYH